MKRFTTSVAAVAVATIATGGLLAGFAPSAHAASGPPWEPDGSSVGSLTFFDAAGNQITGGNLSDSPLAAYVEGSAAPRSGDTKATLFAYTPVNGQVPGQWSGEAVSSSTTYPNASAPGALGTASLPVESGASGDESLSAYAVDFPNTDTSADGYAGLYQLRLKTAASGKSLTTTYDSVDIQVTGSTWSVVYPTPTLTSTSTSLTTSPGSPQIAGTSVQLNATVSPAVGGTVQFKDGSNDIGSPVTVSGGTASISTTSLAVGSHTLHAVFTPATFSAYSGSTGDASFTVSPAPAAQTTTALSAPATAAAFTAVTLTANVTKNSDSSPVSAGSVKFLDGGTPLGTSNLDGTGTATLSVSTFNVGTHNLTAQFLPTNSNNFATSVSPTVVFTGTTPTSVPAEQTVDVNIPAGNLSITTPWSDSNPFDLGSAVLDPKHGKFTATKPFGTPANPANGVTVTDTRADSPGWAASAGASDFTDGSGDVINGQNLTLTGVAAVPISGDTLDASNVTVNDISNSAIYAANASGTDGLKGTHQFATTTVGPGSINIDGQLTLVAPTSTKPGDYTATLIFTVA